MPISPHTRHLIRHTLGWGLLVIGIAGVLLPVLHGLTFLLVGIWLLADYIPWFARLRKRLGDRFPRAHHLVDAFKEKSHWILKRFKHSPPPDSAAPPTSDGN